MKSTYLSAHCALAVFAAGAMAVTESWSTTASISSILTAPATATYCDAPATTITRAASLNSFKDVVPPLPCDGTYFPQDGRCCKISETEEGHFSSEDCLDDPSKLVFQMPLASCVRSNPAWNGCPGNMLHGTCCNGAAVGVARVQESTASGFVSSVDCHDGIAWVMTVSDGTTVTTTPTATMTTGQSTGSAVSNTSQLTGGSATTSPSSSATPSPSKGAAMTNMVPSMPFSLVLGGLLAAAVF